MLDNMNKRTGICPRMIILAIAAISCHPEVVGVKVPKSKHLCNSVSCNPKQHLVNMHKTINPHKINLALTHVP